MRLPDQPARFFRAPHLTRRRIACAVAAAVIADGAQILLLPVAWTFAQSAVDVVAMVLTVWLIGFHLLLLPTFAIEFVPVLNALPTWTGCVAAVIALRRREQSDAPPQKPDPQPPSLN